MSISERETVFQEAERIIYGDREQVYGHPAKNLTNIAKFWVAYLDSKFGVRPELQADDVCCMMALLKIAREVNQHKRDNVVDGIGYLGLIERALES